MYQDFFYQLQNYETMLKKDLCKTQSELSGALQLFVYLTYYALFNSYKQWKCIKSTEIGTLLVEHRINICELLFPRQKETIFLYLILTVNELQIHYSILMQLKPWLRLVIQSPSMLKQKIRSCKFKLCNWWNRIGIVMSYSIGYVRVTTFSPSRVLQ